jgi:dihydroceramidase
MQALGREMASWFGSLEWCNPVVTFTPMITEAFNTLSNIPGIILALIGFINTVHMRFEHRFKILHIVSVVVGLASMLLHCSLKAR